jgi:MscS family membrane protein
MMLLDAGFLNSPFLHNTVRDWIWAGALVVAALLLARPLATWIARIAAGFIRHYTDGQRSQVFVSLIRKPLGSLLALGFGYLAVSHLIWPFDRALIHRTRSNGQVLNVTLMDVIDKLFLLAIIITAALLLSRLLDFIFGLQLERARKKEERDRQQLLPLVRDVAKIGLWTIATFWVLGAVFAVNIPALIAGLGIGGVAIALAAKESVENFFAAFTILTDKPFQTGDGVRLGDLEGNVERIGFRSTRLRHADGSVFIVPNKSLVNEKLENLTQRDTRRVQLKIVIKNSIAPEVLERLISDLKGGLKQAAGLSEPLSVELDSFGEATLGLLITYHLPHPSGTNDAQLKQQVALQVYHILSRHTTSATVAEPAPAEIGKGLSPDQSSRIDNP